LFGGVLVGEVHARVHVEAAGVDLILAVAGELDAQLLHVLEGKIVDELAADSLEIVRAALPGQVGHGPVFQGLGQGLVVLLPGDPAQGQHPSQHILLSGPGRLGPAVGVVLRGGGGQAGQHRGLGKGQLAHVLAKERSGRGLHAIGVGAQIYLVEVDGEDLVLGKVALQPVGEDGLLDLALVALFWRQHQVLDDLLGDGRAALVGLARDDVAHEGPGDGQVVDALVLVEGLVLGREKGPRQVVGHLAQRGQEALLAVEVAEYLAVAGVDRGHQRGAVVGDVLEARQVLGRPQVHEHGRARGHGGCEACKDQHDGEESFHRA